MLKFNLLSEKWIAQKSRSEKGEDRRRKNYWKKWVNIPNISNTNTTVSFGENQLWIVVFQAKSHNFWALPDFQTFPMFKITARDQDKSNIIEKLVDIPYIPVYGCSTHVRISSSLSPLRSLTTRGSYNKFDSYYNYLISKWIIAPWSESGRQQAVGLVENQVWTWPQLVEGGQI